METWQKVGLGVIAFVLAAALRGYVMADVWGLFVVPLGLPAINGWHAYGLGLLAALVTPSNYKTNGGSFLAQILDSVFVTLLSWAFAYLCLWGMTDA